MPKRFTHEFKQDAVQYALKHSDQPLKLIAEQLGIGYSTLDKWLRQMGSIGTSIRPVSPEQMRIKALEKENRELKELNIILKKATAYFAKEAK